MSSVLNYLFVFLNVIPYGQLANESKHERLKCSYFRFNCLTVQLFNSLKFQFQINIILRINFNVKQNTQIPTS